MGLASEGLGEMKGKTRGVGKSTSIDQTPAPLQLIRSVVANKTDTMMGM